MWPPLWTYRVSTRAAAGAIASLQTRNVLRLAAGAFVLLVAGSASATTASVVDVTVHVRSSDDRPVRDAYVALVPQWRPPRKPAAERIAPNGAARLQVEPGDYYLIGGAPGYSVASRGPLAVAGSAIDLSIVVSPLVRVTGIVRDERGRPLREARVSTVNGATIEPLGNFSTLAVRHLASDFTTTTTTADGTWAMRLPTGAVPLLFESSGRAPEWRILPEGHSGVVEVTLSRGTGLTVTTDREDPDVVLTLSRQDRETPSTIPPAREPLFWARSAKQKVLTWESLPAGSYAVQAHYPAHAYLMRSAVTIGTVTLATGEHRKVNMALPPARSPVRTRTAFFLPKISPAALGSEVQTFGRAPGGGVLPLEHALEEVMGGTVLHMRLAEDSRPPFFAITERYFVATDRPLDETRRRMDEGPPAGALHGRADLAAQFRSLEKELPIPRNGVAWLRGCRDRPDVAVPFDIRPSGFALFAVPAECRSLVLELEPFEPVLMSRALQRGEQNLGELVLRAAASADVRVVREPGGEVVSGASVEIVASGDAGQGGTPVVVAQALTDEAGWAHFPALPPYRELRATAKSPAGDRSDAAALRLTPRERGVIDPLPIGKLAALIVEPRIDQAFLARFPSTRVASVHIAPADPFRASEKVQQQLADQEARFAALAPGEWLVSALVMVTKTSYAPFDLGAVVLKPGETRRIEARVLPNLFEGTVTSRGKPVEAKVMLESEGHVLGSRSDATGRFQILLEREGIYRVAVARLSAQGNDIPIGEVAFTDPARRIEIAIPESATAVVRARVHDRPVRARTLIMMSRRNDLGLVDRLTSRGRATDAAGEVTFEDLAPGVWTFTVRDEETGRSAEKSVRIAAGQTHTVDLVLNESSTIAGTIRDLGGMVLPRAHIECIFIGRTGDFERREAASDAEGSFSIPLIAPPPASALCSVIAPNGSVDAFRAVPGQRTSFTVPAATGTLRILHADRLRPRDHFWLISADGRVVRWSAAAMMFAQSRSALVIPALAAGRWKLVRVTTRQQWLALGNGLGASLAAEAEFTLGAGATETITVDEVLAR